MSASASLRRLDQRVLGRRRDRTDGPSAVRGVLHGVGLVSRAVLTLLAVVLLAAVALVVLPADEGNVLVRGVLSAADQVAGPFATVFDVESRPLRATANYGLGAAVYLLLGALAGRLGR